MADTEHDQSGESVELEGILELNFVPDWARKPPQPKRWEDERASRGGRDPERYREGRQRDRQGRRERPDRGPRRPREDRREKAPRDRHAPPPGRPGAVAPIPVAERPARDVREHLPRRDAYRPPREPQLPLDIRIVPDQKGIQAVARRIHHSWMAYPVMELAGIFLARPELTRVRIEVERDVKDLALFQCRVCGAVSREQELALSHLISNHLEDYYEKEEKLNDPPSGSFVCVARCGVSGELLGPPNHHSYTQRVREVHDSCCPGMDLEVYRRRIETVRDEAAIEQWKQEARKQTVYRRKEQPTDGEAPELEYADAVREFREQASRALIRKTRKASVPASVAVHLEDRPICLRIRRQWEEEERFPLKISFVLRAAFKHMHLHVFKARNGTHFVTRVIPGALDPEHVVEGIREVLLYLHDHPGVSRAELLEGLRPGMDMDSETAHEVLSPLSWLIERGHIIEFFNGTLSVPLNSRAHRPPSAPREKRRRKGKTRA